MNNLVRKLALALSLVFTAVLYLAFYSFHYKWRKCFDEFGRCFDSETGVVFLEQSGIVWLAFALFASWVTLYQVWCLMR